MKFQKQVVNGLNYKIVYQVDSEKQIIVSVHKPARHNNSNEAPSVSSVEEYEEEIKKLKDMLDRMNSGKGLGQ